MLSLPAELKTPSPAGLRLLSILWGTMFLFAIVVQAGQTWRETVFWSQSVPPFASLGMLPFAETDPDWQVYAIESAGWEGDWFIDRIGATEVRNVSFEEAGALLAGPDGSTVPVRLRQEGGRTLDITLAHSAENRAEAYIGLQRTFRIASQGIDLLVALMMLVATLLLRLRRFTDPMAIIFSFALLFFAMVGAWRFWAWLGMAPIELVIDAMWLGIALFALPAFPSGRFVPSWGRWLLLAAPVAAALLVIPDLPGAAAQSIRGALVAAVLACIVIRFRRTPAGLERQQIKWVMLAFGLGTFLFAVGAALDYARGQSWLMPDMELLAWILGYSLTRLSFVIMAAGLIVSLLDYRLNDADVAIGRSLGYAAITTVIAVGWALSTYWLNKTITWATGGSNAALATAVSTVVALLVLTPARTKVMNWTEKRFQRALVRLKALPKRIARWQHGDDPDQIAQLALDAVVEGVGAQRAALIAGTESDDPEILARSLCEDEEILQQTGARRPDHRRADLFPLRLPVEDNFGVVATLLLGRRSDGASYSKEERVAIKAITEPLADALRASSRNASLGSAIGELRKRLEELESALKPRTRRKKNEESEDLVHDVAKLMKARQLKNIPLVDGGNRPIGVVTARDVLRALLTDAEIEEAQLINYVKGIGSR